MTELLEKAFSEAAKLPAKQQDELADEQKWEKSFARSQNKLRFLVEEALSEHQSGYDRLIDNL